jgi:predicted ester cyclase
MTISGRVNSIRAAVAALNSGNIDGYLQHFDPTCERWVAGLEQPLSLTNIRDGIQHLYGAFEALYLHEDLLFGNEQFVCARWRLRGVHVKDYLGIAPTRRQIDTQTCEVYEFRGDLVVATWSYGDPGQMFRQIGATAK